MSAPRFFWPVTDEPFAMRPIATFFEYGDAVDFVSANLGKRNLYICKPRYDRRPSGYRFEERLTEVEHLAPGRIAA